MSRSDRHRARSIAPFLPLGWGSLGSQIRTTTSTVQNQSGTVEKTKLP
jgi:hypothetical protein